MASSHFWIYFIHLTYCFWKSLKSFYVKCVEFDVVASVVFCKLETPNWIDSLNIQKLSETTESLRVDPASRLTSYPASVT